MSYVKTPEQLAHIRVSCEIASQVLREVIAAVKPGMTTGDLDALANSLARARGTEPSFTGYLGYPSSLCVSVNDEVVHGLPGDRVLREGDVVGLDYGVKYRGYFSDLARTITVGPPAAAPADAQKLIDVTATALDRGIAQVKPGNHVGDVGRAVQSYVESHGFSVVRDLVGHGVGTAVHEPPAIPNYGRAGSGVQFVPGMVVAIEPMVNVGEAAVRLLDDGWTFKTRDGSLSAHFEDTILVTERGHEVLTRR
ncbi:MAG: type I methionyl aminopeptidase [Candidatus Andersenbacteria bacterium]